MRSVLLTSVGTDCAVALCGALRSHFAGSLRLVGADVKPAVACLPWLNAYQQCPRRRDPRFPEFIARLCDAEGIACVWPLATEDQDLFSGMSGALPAGCRVLCSSAGAVAVANDKVRLYEFAASRGMPVPCFQVIHDRNDLTSAARALGYPAQPVVLKMAAGSGARGLKIIRADVTGAEMFASPLNRDLTLERVESQLQAVKLWPRMLLSEYLPGDEFSVDVLRHGKARHGGVVRQRTESVFGLATDAVVVDRPDLLELAWRFVEAVDLDLVNNVQLRCDAGGLPKLMEINPRVPGTVGLSIAAGANLPAAALALAFGEEAPPCRPVAGTRILRYFGGSVFHP